MGNFAAFLRTSGVSIVWISAVFSPILLIMGAVEDKQWHMLIGCAALLLALWSIMDGIRALRNKLMSNFIGSALVPILSLAVGTMFSLFKYYHSG